MKAIISLAIVALAVQAAASTNMTLTVRGITYENVKVEVANPCEVKIFHSSGILRVPYEELDGDLQKALGYDAQKAEEHRRKIAAATAAAMQRKRAPQPMLISGKIVQALPAGALVEASIVVAVTNRYTKTEKELVVPGKSPVYRESSREVEHVVQVYHKIGTVYIEGVGGYDDYTWRGWAVRAGDHEYTTVMGAYKRVPRFVAVDVVEKK